MKIKVMFVILLSIWELSLGQSLPGNSGLSGIPIRDNTISTNLVLDQPFVDYVNRQLDVDGSDRVIIWADSILAGEDLTFEHADLVFICNYFSTEGKRVKVITAGRNATKKGLAGRKGRTVHIIAKRIENGNFYLSGGDGLRGKDGKNGKNGKRIEAKPKPNGGSPGTPGGDGQRGGNGGDGGNLVISTFAGYEPDITLHAPSGTVGEGGAPGKGGTSYVPKASKVVNPNKSNEQVIYSIVKRKEKDGKKGKKGARGKKGKVTKKTIDKEKFNEHLRNFFFMEPKVLEETGWQIILQTKNEHKKT